MIRLIGIFAVIVTVVLAALAQIIVKQQLGQIGPVPYSIVEWPRYTMRVLLNPVVLVGFSMAFLGAIIYLFAISRLPITYLYPFASLSFPVVLLLGTLVLGEPLTWQKALGSALIIGGVFIGSFSSV